MNGLTLAALALVFVQAAPAAAPDVPAVSDRTWAKADNFWYRRSVPGGNVWINVDAKHGAKTPLFDHQRLAIELNLRGGYDFTPLTLPFADPAARFTVKYDGSNAYIQEGAMAVEFVLDGRAWRCDLQIKWDWNKVPPTDYECQLRRGSAGSTGSGGSSGLSPDGKLEATVVGYNIVVQPAGGGPMTQMTRDGTADFAYDPGSIVWADDSRSLTAYRLHRKIWESDGVSGNMKPLIAAVSVKLPDGR